MRRVGVVLCVVAAVAPAGVRADPATEARFLDEMARRSYAARRYDEAFESFLFAHRIAPSPRLLYNAALCAELGGRRALAFAMLQDYLAGEDPDASRRADATARAARIRARLAVVRIESEPPGATLYVDSRELGAWGVAPRELVLEPGSHRIEGALADHHPESVDVMAVVGEARTVALALRRQSGLLLVDGSPAGGAVVVLEGGLAVAVGRLGEPLALPAGGYEVRLEADGHDTVTADVAIPAGETVNRTLIAPPRDPTVGRLLVATGETVARIAVDGRWVGVTPAVLTLPPGRHRIVLETEGHPRVTRDVELAPGRTTNLHIPLDTR